MEPPDTPPQSRRSGIIMACLIACMLAGFATGDLRLLSSGGRVLLSGVVWKAAALAVFIAMLLSSSFWRQAAGRLGAGRFCLHRAALPPEAFAFGLALLLLSDYPHRRWVFYAIYSPWVSPLYIVFFGCVLGAAVFCARRLLGDRTWSVLLSPAALLLCQAAVAFVFLNYAAGRLIFSDDHPTFLYRLQLLAAQFPRIPFYNPEWNAGVEARDFFSTGSLGVFFLSWPLFKLWGSFDAVPQAQVYMLIIPYLFVFIVPWSVFFAARILRSCPRSASIAGLLALAPSLSYFSWMLKYGTIGFSVSTGLAPLAFALSARVLFVQQPRWLHVAGAAVAVSLCILWPLTGVCFIALAFSCLAGYRTVLAPDRRRKTAALAALVLIINLPWIALWVHHAEVFSYITGSSRQAEGLKQVKHHIESRKQTGGVSPAGQEASLNRSKLEKLAAASKVRIREEAVRINPLILLFFFPGLAVMPLPGVRKVLFSTIGLLLLLCTFGDSFMSHLDLVRMAVPASLFMAVAAGGGVRAALENLSSKPAGAPRWKAVVSLSRASAAVMILGSLVITPINAGAIFRNASDEHYTFLTKEAADFIAAVRQHGGPGRTVFAGFVLHDLSASSPEGRDGGHLAPLAKFTGRSLYASHFLHALWSIVDPIPAAYRARGAAGIEEFFDLINASGVAVFREEWRKYCEEQPHYSKVYSDNRFTLYSRASSGQGWFQEGSGEVVRTGGDRLEIILGTQRAVIKFRWQPELRIEPAALGAISPFPVFRDGVGAYREEEVSYIRLTAAPKAVKNRQKFTIGYHAAN